MLGDGLRIARVKGNQAPAFGAALALAPVRKGWQRRFKRGHFQCAEAGRHHTGFFAPNVQIVHVELAGNTHPRCVKIGIAVIATVVGDLHPNVRCRVKAVNPAVLGVLAARADVAAASLRVQHAGQANAAGVDGGIPCDVPVVQKHALTGLGAHTYPGVIQVVHGGVVEVMQLPGGNVAAVDNGLILVPGTQIRKCHHAG